MVDELAIKQKMEALEKQLQELRTANPEKYIEFVKALTTEIKALSKNLQ